MYGRPRDASIPPDIRQGVRNSLMRLRDRLDEKGIRFTAVVLPIAYPLERWTAREKESRAAAISILSDLRIQYVDLSEALETEAGRAALAALPEPHSRWHPDDRLAEILADYLYKKNLLSLASE
jgi:hypothetical protein